MTRITGRRFDDPMNGNVTYELDDGRHIMFHRDDLRVYGLKIMLMRYGIEGQDANARVDVIQSGRKIGTLPGDFDPLFIKSNSFLYDPRPGDFRSEGDAWIADPQLGPGDLEAIPGFAWETPQPRNRNEEDHATLRRAVTGEEPQA